MGGARSGACWRASSRCRRSIGNTRVYLEGIWQDPIATGLGSVDFLSCPATTFCLAAGPHHVSSFHGTGWSATELSGRTRATGLACADPTFCMLLKTSSVVERHDGHRWLRQRVAPRGVGLSDVTCLADDFCVAVDRAQQAFEWDGRTWSPPTTVDPSGAGPMHVTCAAVTFCVAVDDSAQTLWLAGGASRGGWPGRRRTTPTHR